MHLKVADIEIAYVLKLELTNGNRRQETCCPKTVAEYTLSSSL